MTLRHIKLYMMKLTDINSKQLREVQLQTKKTFTYTRPISLKFKRSSNFGNLMV